MLSDSGSSGGQPPITNPEVAHLRDFSFEDIVRRLPVEHLFAVTLEQESDLQDHGAPTNRWIDQLPPDTADLLRDNDEIYDDEVEDFIDADSLMEDLYELNQRERNSQEVTVAIRARRTIAVRYLLECILAEQMGVKPADNAA